MPVKIFYTDHFVLPLPPGHRFPMEKYYLLRKRVVEAGVVPSEDICEPDPATDEEILRAHTPDYLHRVKTGALSEAEIRRIGFPWSLAMVERSRRSCGATLMACRAALREGLAVNLAGGTHHAFADAGEGYCVFNDSVIAARAMQAEGRVRRVVVLDCDVHQGNGTAAMVRDDPTIFTFSLHGARNFPLRKEQSDLDVELPDGTEDELYLEALERGLHLALERARADLALYLAGADPFADDRYGRLRLSRAGLQARDERVLTTCRQRGLPVAITMAGGYARQVQDTVEIHWQTVRCAAELFRAERRSRATP